LSCSSLRICFSACFSVSFAVLICSTSSGRFVSTTFARSTCRALAPMRFAAISDDFPFGAGGVGAAALSRSRPGALTGAWVPRLSAAFCRSRASASSSGSA
jgi:hypothetical protein